MPSDSLTYADYMLLARWLSGRLEPRIGGRNGQKAPTLGKYTPKGEAILMEQLRKEKEVL